MRADTNIPHKANRILNLILLAFFLILIRVWYLAFVQDEYHHNQARKPKRKSVIQKVERATIRDRFNIPLSQNRIAYNVSVRYADLREIPSHNWEKDENGKKVKKLIRGPYIASLAELLAKELNMDAQSIEDIIYAKASLFPHTPFIVKENLSEREYYRIRMLQKEWRGVEAQRVSQRVYPLHEIGCDIVGYMGAINPSEYVRIAEEIKTLQEYIKKRELGEIVFLPSGYKDPFEVRNRLKVLQEKAYTINDQIGKAGIEGSCDELLRGSHGKLIMETDPKGNVLRELPGGKKGVSGQRVFLSISAELQQYAEELLAQHEAFRDVKDVNGNIVPGTPWIKGGAAIAMNPKTGELLALASYPRFDPNDFIPAHEPKLKKERQSSIAKWFENERHVEDLWNGKVELTREIYLQNEGRWEQEKQPLTWSYFLSTILPPESSSKKAIDEIRTVASAYQLQKALEELMQLTEAEDPAVLIHVLYSNDAHIAGKKHFPSEVLEFIQNNLAALGQTAKPSIQVLAKFLSSLHHNDDKLLVLDLIRLIVCVEHWDPELIEEMGHLTLSEFLQLSQSFKKAHDKVKEITEKLHHEIGFKQWRAEYFKDFLKQKRQEEKAQKKPAGPYTEYLEKIERNLFKQFWDACKFIFLDAVFYQNQRISIEAHSQLKPYLDRLASLQDPSFELLKRELSHLTPEQAIQCMKCMRSFEDLTRPLYGKYRQLRNSKGVQLEKHLAASFYPLSGFGYGRSQAFRQSTPQGSVYKIAVAYEALRERYRHLKENHLSLSDLNPLTIIDQIQMNAWGSSKQLLGYTLDGEPIRRVYKGGVLPRTHPNIGRIDVIGAIEQSSNIYFSLLAAEHVADPSYLEKATRDLGLGSRTGIDLPGEIRGSIPDDLADNKTGLYSFAMGQHSLIVTPLQTAVMYSAFANYGKVLKPQILHLTVGKKTSEDLFSARSGESGYPFQDSLALAGIDFPLFTEALSPAYNPLIHEIGTEVKREVFLPKEIRNVLVEGMSRVITGVKGTARAPSIRYLRTYPKAAKDYERLKGQLVGKTGTAEIFHKQWLDAESKVEIRNHIWFAGIVFPEDDKLSEEKWGEAELVVIVYLRFSQAGGKEATPMAAQIASKWREIQKKYGGSSYLDKISSMGEDGPAGE